MSRRSGPFQKCVGSLVVLVSTAACDRNESSGTVAADTLRNGEIVVSTESELIAGLSDMTVGNDGRLYLLDARSRRVVRLEPASGDTAMIGRDGEGPGEFRRPIAVTVANDTVWVHDPGTGRLQAFSTSGEYFAGSRVEGSELGGGASIRPGGHLAAATGGRDSTMVEVFDRDARRVSAFGTPVAPPSEFWDFTAMKSQIAAGGVPDQFRNIALPEWDPDGSLWLVLVGEGTIRRYSAGGDLQWEIALEDQAMDGIRNAFFARNRDNPNPTAIYPLRFVRDLKANRDGLWLVLNTPEDVEDSVVLLIAPDDGSVKRRVVVEGVPDATQIAMPADSNELYLSRSGDASVLRFRLPTDS